MRGEGVSIGIVGASVTAGHGLFGLPTWQVFYADFKTLFPSAKIFVVAVPVVGSEFCTVHASTRYNEYND